MTWLSAFLLTEGIEAPVYLYAGRRLPPARRWFLALATSAVTHPVVWFAFPWQTASWELCFLGAETFAVVVEGGIGRLVGLDRPWRWSLTANAASVALGFAMQLLAGQVDSLMT